MEKEAQGKVIEFSMLEEENKRLEQQMQLTEQQMQVFHQLKAHLEEMAKHKGEFLASVGSGVFMKSELLDNKKVLINVGSGVIVEKTVGGAGKIIDKQARKIEEVREEIERMVAKNFDLMVKLEGELRQLVEKG